MKDFVRREQREEVLQRNRVFFFVDWITQFAMIRDEICDFISFDDRRGAWVSRIISISDDHVRESGHRLCRVVATPTSFFLMPDRVDMDLWNIVWNQIKFVQFFTLWVSLICDVQQGACRIHIGLHIYWHVLMVLCLLRRFTDWNQLRLKQQTVAVLAQFIIHHVQVTMTEH